MKTFWEGNKIRLRLFKLKDKQDFFISNNYYCYMNKGHVEWELASNFPNFDDYFNQNHVMHFEHNYSLIIANLIDDRAIGIIQVYDTNNRNGTFFLGLYLMPEFDLLEYYFDTINIIRNFMFNELRYNEGYLSLSDDQRILLNGLISFKFEKCAHISKRYYGKMDQHLFRLKSGELVWR